MTLPDYRITEKIIERVRALMEAQALTQEELAERSASLSRAWVGKFLRGQIGSPGIAAIESLALALGVSPATLLGYNTEGSFHPIAFRTAAFLHEELTASGL